MGAFALRIRMLNGTYTAHRADGSQDDFPDPARVHSAFVQAACTGSTAVWDGERLVPSDESLLALKWFEEHPPDGLEIPEVVRLSPEPPVAYRKEGLIKKEQARVLDKTSGKPTSDGVAVAGHFGYTWNQEVPDEVKKAFEALCADISHIGEALSPAVLETEDISEEAQRTHGAWLKDERVGRFISGGRRVRVPVPGRFEELQTAHLKAYPAKPPSEAGDKHKWTEGSVRSSPPVSKVRQQRYVLPRETGSSLPWSHAIALTVDSIAEHGGEAGADELAMGIPADQRVAWCVALHKALAKRIGGTAPPLITGKYRDRETAPANRLAIQYMDSQTLASTCYPELGQSRDLGVFLLLIPSDAPNDDLLYLEQALTGLTEVWSRHGVLSLHLSKGHVPCDSFWRPTVPSLTRCWVTSPAMISDVRPQGRGWTLEDSTLTAVGFVWREHEALKGALSGSTNKYRSLLKQVRESLGTQVLSVSRLIGDGSRYAHHLPQGMVAEPFTALLEPGDQMPDQALVAIGQTRHLGGGLLVPMDITRAALDGMRREKR